MTDKIATEDIDGLDKGIYPYVKIFRDNGIETYESCEGGKDHAFYEPTIRFHGEEEEGWKALYIAILYGMPICELRKRWEIVNMNPVGPLWEITFVD